MSLDGRLKKVEEKVGPLEEVATLVREYGFPDPFPQAPNDVLGSDGIRRVLRFAPDGDSVLLPELVPAEPSVN